jgi:DNA-directed RNA polymerase specialized sigma24 family protein
VPSDPIRRRRKHSSEPVSGATTPGSRERFAPGSPEAKELARLMPQGPGLLRDPRDQEEVDSDVAYRLVQNWENVQDPTRGRASALAGTIRRRMSIDQRRRNTRQPPAIPLPPETDGPAHDDVEETILNKVVAQQVNPIIEDLLANEVITRKMLEAWLKRTIHQKSATEIAADLGLGKKAGRRTIVKWATKVNALIAERLQPSD